MRSVIVVERLVLGERFVDRLNGERAVYVAVRDIPVVPLSKGSSMTVISTRPWERSVAHDFAG